MTGETAIGTAEACAAAIAEIGALDRALTQAQADLDKRVAALKADSEGKALPLQTKRAALELAIALYCNENRAALTANHERKFGEFATGTVGWRLGQPKLEVEPARAAAIIALLEKKKLKRLLRYKVEIDARAIIKEPEAVKGIKGLKIVPPQEKFWIEPVDMKLADKPSPSALGD